MICIAWFVGATAVGAQQRDTTKARLDSLKADSARVRARADSITRARADSLKSDSLRREDLAIIAEQRKRGDSIKAPLAKPESPTLTEHPGVFVWDRERLGASGALTLGDLLETVPGLTVFRTGWIGSPEQASYLGDFSNVRVFYDGIELDPSQPSSGGIHDLGAIQLWPLEEVRIERGAVEVRMYLSTWRVRSVTPATRVDIGTGDLSTNGYRGYFGRRYARGEALQLGAYQFSSRDPRGIGDADMLSIFGRVGFARRGLSIDASLLQTRREHTSQPRSKASGRDSLSALDATLGELYARVAYADTARGWWTQLVASRQRDRYGALADSARVDTTKNAADTTVRLPQYVAAFGWQRGPLALSATARVRQARGQRSTATMLRGSWQSRWLAVSGTAERRGDRELSRVEGSARLTPFPWIAVSGAISRTSFDDTTFIGKPLAYRGEAALRVSRMWIGAGFLSRDPARLIAPVLFDTGFRSTGDSAAPTALFATIRGKFWKDVGFDVAATKWNAERAYRPTYQARTKLYIDTSWPSRFPSGNLNILFAVTHDYRTQVPFPIDRAILRSRQYRSIGAQLEIRLLQATISYQFRNVLNEIYDQVPGYFTPRPTQFYGVRWNFFN